MPTDKCTYIYEQPHDPGSVIISPRKELAFSFIDYVPYDLFKPDEPSNTYLSIKKTDLVARITLAKRDLEAKVSSLIRTQERLRIEFKDST